jgi:hypothetical protein
VNSAIIKKWIIAIEELPVKLSDTVLRLNERQLDTPYRPGGWTVRQVVHHIGDSHLNGYIRFKLAITEDAPTIKPYKEELWAELEDYKLLPVQDSLEFIEILHKRWVIILNSMSGSQIERELIHPELGRLNLKRYLGLYAWHGEHHLAHITSLIRREGW